MKTTTLPGSYINFVNVARAPQILGERGTVAFPVHLNWGVADAVFTLSQEDYYKKAFETFGYTVDHPEMKALNDLFKNVQKAHFVRVGTASTKAENTYAVARCAGTRGNAIKTVISTADTLLEVKTYVDETLVDVQAVVDSTNQLMDNAWVRFKPDVALAATAGLPLTGGTDVAPTPAAYESALEKLENYSFNIVACASADDAVKDAAVAFVKRLREEVGVKVQAVVYRKSDADSEAVISVENKVVDALFDESALVYWVAGVLASCPLNRSATHKVYDGAFEIEADYKQEALRAAIEAGKFILHRTGDDRRVLKDINTFRSFTDEKSEDFASNQTVRILDQIANDIAYLFSKKYLGVIPNDNDGRISLWTDIVKHHQELQKMRAIEGFVPDHVRITKGETKQSVVIADAITPINAMTQLYMTVVVQ